MVNSIPSTYFATEKRPCHLRVAPRTFPKIFAAPHPKKQKSPFRPQDGIFIRLFGESPLIAVSRPERRLVLPISSVEY